MRLLSSIRSSIGGGAFREFDDELDSHLAMHIEDNVRNGMTPDAARRDAILKLGGLQQTRERYSDRRGVPAVEHLVRDVRFAARTLGRHPGFTIVAVLALALGIGANTAIFSVVNAVLLRPLPYKQAERLVWIWGTNPRNDIEHETASAPDYNDWKAQGQSFEEMGAFVNTRLTLTGSGEPERYDAAYVTDGFFEVLGVSAAMTFGPPCSRST